MKIISIVVSINQKIVIVGNSLDWYYRMMTKEQYIQYIVDLDDNTYDFVLNAILEFPLHYTLDDICTGWIFPKNMAKYREDLAGYLHLTYTDLLDETTSSNISYQDILDAL
jgi:hypothetical protein